MKALTVDNRNVEDMTEYLQARIDALKNELDRTKKQLELANRSIAMLIEAGNKT